MNVLLDTHVMLWILADSDRLTLSAINAYQNPDNTVYFSAASFWEIGIKISLGKLSLQTQANDWAEEISKELATNGVRLLAIDPSHCAKVATLPFHHRDPFDRLLIAQALCEDMALVTADTAFADYGVEIIWM